MKTSLILFVLLSGMFGVGIVDVEAQAEDTPATALLVLAKHDDTLAIVDPATLKVVARLPVGNDPHEVIASTDGKTAFVSNYGFGAYHTLSVVDLVAKKTLTPVDLGPLRGPHDWLLSAGKYGLRPKQRKRLAAMIPRPRT